MLVIELLELQDVLFHVNIQALEEEIGSGERNWVVLSHLKEVSCFLFKILLVLIVYLFNVLLHKLTLCIDLRLVDLIICMRA